MTTHKTGVKGGSLRGGNFSGRAHSLTGLRNRAVLERTRMLLKELPNGAVTELTNVRD
jgi:hypothetical protein